MVADFITLCLRTSRLTLAILVSRGEEKREEGEHNPSVATKKHRKSFNPMHLVRAQRRGNQARWQLATLNLLRGFPKKM